MTTVAVIDYGMGNLHSVAKALERAGDGGTRIHVTDDATTIRAADRVVFPGVGAMRDCMSELARLGLDEVLREIARNKPLLGVCVGMQALFESSEENDGTECLGILPGRVLAFERNMVDHNTGERLKIPHMGWNEVHQLVEHPMWDGIEQDTRFYFVHSYYAEPAGPDLLAAFTLYPHPVAAAVVQENVFGVQFHPEKSQEAGLRLYANFLGWGGA